MTDAWNNDFLNAGILDTEIVCMASWECISGLYLAANVYILANEEHLALETAIDMLLDRICRETSRNDKVLICLKTPPRHDITRAIARARGFAAILDTQTDADILSKVSIGRPLHANDWSALCAWLRNFSALSLPTAFPDFSGEDPLMMLSLPNGQPGTIRLSTLETLLAPTLILLKGRPGVIVPIRRRFADDLLGSGDQLNLLASPKTVALSERVYFSACRNERLLKSGCLLIFYESGSQRGRSSAIAVARVTQTVIANKGDISATLLHHGVLEAEQIECLTVDDKVAVTIFDNLMAFKKPISLKRLREIGCVNAANLVSATRVASEHIISILREGEPGV